MIKNVGVLTSGGDAPGMNAAVRSIVRCGISKGLNMFAIYNGFNGLLEGSIEPAGTRSVCDILQRGGTVLCTARCKEFIDPEGQKKGFEIAKKFGLDAIVVVGGDGSFKGARALANLGLPTVAIPGTIDNDIACTEYTIGFDTALNTAMNAVDKIRDTMTSHSRCCLVEVMGRNAGYLALEVAIATGAECALIPEREFDFENDIINAVKSSKKVGKKNHIIIVAEGMDINVTEMAKIIEKSTGVSTRASILGHIQRGGSPTCRDRVMASRMGQKAIELLVDGQSNRVVCVREGQITNMDINEALAMKKDINNEEMLLSKMLSI